MRRLFGGFIDLTISAIQNKALNYYGNVICLKLTYS